MKQYEENNIYRDVIDEMKRLIETEIGVENFEYISGGERRDWFFSYIIANMLGKPHITIYKDLSSVVSDYTCEETKEVSDLNGVRVLHVADLMNQSSSYKRAWIPAINGLNGTIYYSVVAVDRMQGGREALIEDNIKCYSLIDMGEELFKEGARLNYISNEQLEMILKFTEDPDKTMQEFVEEHPEFIENALNSDEKTAMRAKLCVESGFYGLKGKEVK
ncbi:MAG: orotate phosphoribosyltransferase [Oscillospiraceae bacterium]|nr:orotate phosphoribosyltransferase [Oscillospiraceae bacterium]